MPGNLNDTDCTFEVSVDVDDEGVVESAGGLQPNNKTASKIAGNENNRRISVS